MTETPSETYQALQDSLAQGWNTWNTRSVLSHVLLPEGIALNLGLKEYCDGQFLREALVGRSGDDAESVRPGLRSYGGSYTELTLRWRDIELFVQSAAMDDDLVLLVTPRAMQPKPATLVIASGLLWNRPGTIRRDEGASTRLVFETPSRSLAVHASGGPVGDVLVDAATPYLAVSLLSPVAVSTGRPMSPEEAATVLAAARMRLLQEDDCFGAHAEAHRAMRTCLAWDTIYEPSGRRVVSPVSRAWNLRYGGYVLFCWDTYFAAGMASLDNPALAYANAVEITRARLPEGFVPNYVAGRGMSSYDRSQPPVGATMVLEIYRRHRETWFLELVFDDLQDWNDWFHAHRRNPDGTLSWGSDPFHPVAERPWSPGAAGSRLGAALESGLDNSPMYDDIPYDPGTHRMRLADVGLTALHLLDCESLASLAAILGRAADAARLRKRATETDAALATPWNERLGIYCNRRTDTGEFSDRLSPTNFYALFSSRVSPGRIDRMIREHLLNPEEFWGEWILPSIARNDPAYADQTYWRGRIWAPLNYLVALALRRRPETAAAYRALAEKSERLLLKEWRERGHIHENYDAETGDGCGVANSDPFYHWGGLLALPSLLSASPTGRRGGGGSTGCRTA